MTDFTDVSKPLLPKILMRRYLWDMIWFTAARCYKADIGLALSYHLQRLYSHYSLRGRWSALRHADANAIIEAFPVCWKTATPWCHRQRHVAKSQDELLILILANGACAWKSMPSLLDDILSSSDRHARRLGQKANLMITSVITLLWSA